MSSHETDQSMNHTVPELRNLPKNTAVRVSEPESATINHATGYIIGHGGEEDINGEYVPRGHVKLEFHFVDSVQGEGVVHQEAFQYDSIEAVWC